MTGDLKEGSGGNLVVGQESNWDVLDPALGTGAVTWRTCLYQIYEFLVSRDLDNPQGVGNDVVPRITKSIDQSSDGKTYTFHLQPGVTFTDGTPFDADAVMWNVGAPVGSDQDRQAERPAVRHDCSRRSQLVLGPSAVGQHDSAGQDPP